MMQKAITLFLLFIICLTALGQTQEEKDEAVNLTMRAIRLMDNGEYDESIKLLKKACKIDPKTYSYPYELGYAYYLKGDLKKSIKIYEKVVEMENINDQCYQMLGNIYDYDGNPEKAIETYNLGLESFPNSGRLYLELGVMHHYDPAKAIEFHEKGIEVEPSYPSNYYWASKIYCNSENEIWGLLYGEVFVNIERGSKRTEEISKLLFDIYKSEIEFTSDSTLTVSFCKSHALDVANPEKLPFSMIYETCASVSVAGVDEISLMSIHKIRKHFITFYYESGFEQDYPNFIFDWNQYLESLDYFECYNHWMFMQGNPDEFNEWYGYNEERFDDFINWFIDNPLVVDEEHNFHQNDY